MSQHTIRIDGMSCGHCVARVRKALEGVSGLKVLNVSVGEARVEADTSQASEEAFRHALDDAGYRVVEVKAS